MSKLVRKASQKLLRIILCFTIIQCNVAYAAEENVVNNRVTQEAEVSQSTQIADVIDFSNYYYNQLSDEEKNLYTLFANSKEKFLNNENFLCFTGRKENLSEDFRQIKRSFVAYLYDNPEASMYMSQDLLIKCFDSEILGNEYFDYTVFPNFQSTIEDYEKNLKEVECTVRAFVDTLSGTEIEKLTKISNWLTKKGIYDSTLVLSNNNNIYGAIIEKKAVCSGYSFAFKYVADMAGLNVLYVTGNVIYQKSYFYHAWNLVYLNDQCFLIDITSNLGRSIRCKSLLCPIDISKNGYTYRIRTSYFESPY